MNLRLAGVRLIGVTFAALLISGSALADLGSVPYDPTVDKPKLALDLGMPEADILVDRRCVFSKSEKWERRLKLKAFSTCVLAVSQQRLILATIDPDKGRYLPLLTYEMAQLRDVALREDEAPIPSMEAEGKKLQLQFITDDGYISVTAWRGKVSDRPFDPRGARDAFEVLKAAGVQLGVSPGRVDVETSSSGGWLLRFYNR